MPRVEELRDNYHNFARVTTRLKDNNGHGQVHSAVYMSWIDTAVTHQFREHLPQYPGHFKSATPRPAQSNF